MEVQLRCPETADATFPREMTDLDILKPIWLRTWEDPDIVQLNRRHERLGGRGFGENAV